MIIKTYPDGSELTSKHIAILAVAGVCYSVAVAVYIQKRDARWYRKHGYGK
jgi:predicted membrane channel-forming protein YqfA (hemolysin III family)